MLQHFIYHLIIYTTCIYLDYSCLDIQQKCSDWVQCIFDGMICNGHTDCNDASDEDPDFCKGNNFYLHWSLMIVFSYLNKRIIFLSIGDFSSFIGFFYPSTVLQFINFKTCPTYGSIAASVYNQFNIIILQQKRWHLLSVDGLGFIRSIWLFKIMSLIG